jgi:hypothetical protein
MHRNRGRTKTERRGSRNRGLPNRASLRLALSPDLNPAAMRPMLRARMRPDLEGKTGRSKTGRSKEAKISARAIR